MTRTPATIGLDQPVVVAARLMVQRQIRRLLVVEPCPEGQRLLGILSTKNVLHAFPPHINPFAIEAPDPRLNPTTVGQVMTARPVTTTPDSPIEEAANEMCTHKIGALPVVRDGMVAGIITESDIFRAFTSIFSSQRKGARVTFDASCGEDVFELVVRLSRKHHIQVHSLIWTRHDELPVCVVRLVGESVEQMLEELWGSGHAIVNVIHFTGAAAETELTPRQFEAFRLPDRSSNSLYPST